MPRELLRIQIVDHPGQAGAIFPPGLRWHARQLNHPLADILERKVRPLPENNSGPVFEDFLRDRIHASGSVCHGVLSSASARTANCSETPVPEGGNYLF